MGIASDALKNFKGFNLKNMPRWNPYHPVIARARAAERYWLCGRQ